MPIAIIITIIMAAIIEDARGQHANDADGGVVDDGCMVDAGDWADVIVLDSCWLLDTNVAGEAIELLMIDGDALVFDEAVGADVQSVQFVFISLLQIVTLVQQNNPESKVKVLMRLSCIDWILTPDTLSFHQICAIHLWDWWHFKLVRFQTTVM